MRRARKTSLIAVTLLATLFVMEVTSAQGRGSGPGGGPGPAAGQAQQQGRSGSAPQGRGGSTQQGRGGNAQQGPNAGGQPGPARGGSAQAQQIEIRERLRSRDVYGGELMSNEERRQYRDRVNAAVSNREYAEIRAQHMNEMQARARAQGQPLDPPIYGEHMLTREERNEYRNRIQSAESAAERERVQAEHRDMIRERAMLLGLDPPPID